MALVQPVPGGVQETTRLRITVQGAVQGVGYRPFVYRCAEALGLSGWVANSSGGVVAEVEGDTPAVEQFIAQLQSAPPANARVERITSEVVACGPWLPQRIFQIRASLIAPGRTTGVLPDLATCPDCLREVLDPRNRRHRYPFTCCTRCGPRYSIIAALPYDRSRTSMQGFRMCAACAAEYADPHDRRFHAEPNACPHCGPQLALWDARGGELATRDDALRAAARCIEAGDVVALQGVGGFQLLVDARNGEAVARLRVRKRRPDKPFAVMFADTGAVSAHCRLSRQEDTLLSGVEAPIVLLRRREVPATQRCLAAAVAPGCPDIGAMLPATPLHHLLLRELGFPVVATSGNASGEPLVHEGREALTRLAGIADVFLVHDRPILRPVDDSVLRVVADRPMLLRRARGYAPLPVPVAPAQVNVLGVGGQLKNTVTLAVDDRAHVGPHIGDLHAVEAHALLERALHDLPRLHAATVDAVAHDLHPDYTSTHAARQLGLPLIGVQHHVAHVCAGMAEHALTGTVLGVAWDGTGYGPDGTVWGGEFLRVSLDAPGPRWQRVAHLRQFRLPGGERAVREPCRAALGVLHELFGRDGLAQDDLAPLRGFTPNERDTLCAALERGINAPVTSSAGRLFDAVAALCDLRQRASYEGQAAAELEWMVQAQGTGEGYAFALRERGAAGVPLIVDWGPAVTAMLADQRGRVPPGRIAAHFHDGLVAAIVAVARRSGEQRVVLAGGCFQNRYLLEHAAQRLGAAGFEVYWPQRVPPNDGGLSLGQVAWARALLREQH